MKNNKKAFSLIELSIVILIIGILIAGVTQSSRLIKQFRLSTARTLTQSSPVTSITGLALWLDTTSEVSFADAQTEDGQTVTSWIELNPQVITKSTLAVTTGGVGAVYTDNAINGLPALNFSGNSSYEVTMNNITPNALKTIFVVFKTTAASPQRGYLYDSTPALNSTSCAAGQNTFIAETTAGGAGLNAGTVCGGGACSTTLVPVGALAFEKAHLVMVMENAATSFVRYNGTQSANMNMPGTSGFLNTTMRIGNACSRTEIMKGFIGELIIFDRALKSEEYRSVESYLAKKWNIKIS